MTVDVIIPLVCGVICLSAFIVFLQDTRKGKAPKFEDGFNINVSYAMGMTIAPILAILFFIAAVVKLFEL